MEGEKIIEMEKYVQIVRHKLTI